MNQQNQESILNGASILGTGGTGSIRNHAVKKGLKEFSPGRITIFSREELIKAEKYENLVLSLQEIKEMLQ